MKSYSHQTVIKAVNGDNDSLCEIFAEYELYICKIATQKALSRGKCRYHQLIEESKAYVYENLVMEIRRFRVATNLSETNIKNTFDCFCKKVIRHSLFRFFSNDDKHKNKEVSIDDAEKHIETIALLDTYSTDKRLFNVFGNQISIDLTLAEALLSLPEEKRTIVLAKTVLGMSDEQIGKQMKMPCRTVNHKRNKALAEMRKLLDKHSDK